MFRSLLISVSSLLILLGCLLGNALAIELTWKNPTAYTTGEVIPSEFLKDMTTLIEVSEKGSDNFTGLAAVVGESWKGAIPKEFKQGTYLQFRARVELHGKFSEYCPVVIWQVPYLDPSKPIELKVAP